MPIESVAGASRETLSPCGSSFSSAWDSSSSFASSSGSLCSFSYAPASRSHLRSPQTECAFVVQASDTPGNSVNTVHQSTITVGVEGWEPFYRSYQATNISFSTASQFGRLRSQFPFILNDEQPTTQVRSFPAISSLCPHSRSCVRTSSSSYRFNLTRRCTGGSRRKAWRRFFTPYRTTARCVTHERRF